MIGRLSGTLLEKNPPQLLLDVQGVAYEVDVPMSTFYNLPATGAEISLYTHLAVREDAHQLFGFATEAERQRNGDPRPSLEARYPSREAWARQLAVATERLVAERLLLQEDADRLIAAAHETWDVYRVL